LSTIIKSHARNEKQNKKSSFLWTSNQAKSNPVQGKEVAYVYENYYSSQIRERGSNQNKENIKTHKVSQSDDSFFFFFFYRFHRQFTAVLADIKIGIGIGLVQRTIIATSVHEFYCVRTKWQLNYH
jgi:hypothetical protein